MGRAGGTAALYVLEHMKSYVPLPRPHSIHWTTASLTPPCSASACDGQVTCDILALFRGLRQSARPRCGVVWRGVAST